MLAANVKSPMNLSHVVGSCNSNENGNEMRFSFNNAAAKKRSTERVGAEVPQNYFHQQSSS